MSELLRAGNFLVTRARKEWAWGEWDCNIFVAEFLDHVYGGNRTQDIKSKYNSQRSAIRFQQSYTPAPKWIEEQGFTLMVARPMDMDIILEERGKYWTASIAYGGELWSVTESVGMTLQPIGDSAYYLGRRYG